MLYISLICLALESLCFAHETPHPPYSLICPLMGSDRCCDVFVLVNYCLFQYKPSGSLRSRYMEVSSNCSSKSTGREILFEAAILRFGCSYVLRICTRHVRPMATLLPHPWMCTSQPRSSVCHPASGGVAWGLYLHCGDTNIPPPRRRAHAQCMHTCVFVCAHARVCVSLCVCVCVSVCGCVWCLCVSIYLCVCVCVVSGPLHVICVGARPHMSVMSPAKSSSSQHN